MTKEKGRKAKETGMRADLFEIMCLPYPKGSVPLREGPVSLSALAGAGGVTGQNIRKLQGLKGNERLWFAKRGLPSCLQMRGKEWIDNELLPSKE